MDGNYWGNKIQAFNDGDENPILPHVEYEPLGLEIRRPLVTFLSIIKAFLSLQDHLSLKYTLHQF